MKEVSERPVEEKAPEFVGIPLSEHRIVSNGKEKRVVISVGMKRIYDFYHLGLEASVQTETEEEKEKQFSGKVYNRDVFNAVEAGEVLGGLIDAGYVSDILGSEENSPLEHVLYAVDPLSVSVKKQGPNGADAWVEEIGAENFRRVRAEILETSINNKVGDLLKVIGDHPEASYGMAQELLPLVRKEKIPAALAETVISSDPLGEEAKERAESLLNSQKPARRFDWLRFSKRFGSSKG